MALQVNDGSLLQHLQDLRDAFAAGLNRGCFVSSVIRHSPIDGEYPTFSEYVEEKYGLVLHKEVPLEMLPADNLAHFLINEERK